MPNVSTSHFSCDVYVFLFTSNLSFRYNRYSNFIIPKINPSGCSCEVPIAIKANGLATYISKTRHPLVEQLWEIVTFFPSQAGYHPNVKKNASHIPT